MAHMLKDFIRKAAIKAQQSLDLDPEKTEKFLQKTDTFVDVTAQKLEEAEKKVNEYEGDLGGRFKSAKEAFMQHKARKEDASSVPADEVSVTPPSSPRKKSP